MSLVVCRSGSPTAVFLHRICCVSVRNTRPTIPLLPATACTSASEYAASTSACRLATLLHRNDSSSSSSSPIPFCSGSVLATRAKAENQHCRSSPELRSRILANAAHSFSYDAGLPCTHIPAEKEGKKKKKARTASLLQPGADPAGRERSLHALVWGRQERAVRSELRARRGPQLEKNTQKAAKRKTRGLGRWKHMAGDRRRGTNHGKLCSSLDHDVVDFADPRIVGAVRGDQLHLAFRSLHGAGPGNKALQPEKRIACFEARSSQHWCVSRGKATCRS